MTQPSHGLGPGFEPQLDQIAFLPSRPLLCFLFDVNGRLDSFLSCTLLFVTQMGPLNNAPILVSRAIAILKTSCRGKLRNSRRIKYHPPRIKYSFQGNTVLTHFAEHFVHLVHAIQIATL